MLAFMWQDDLISSAKFVTACLHKMSASEGQASDACGGWKRSNVICSHLLLKQVVSATCFCAIDRAALIVSAADGSP